MVKLASALCIFSSSAFAVGPLRVGYGPTVAKVDHMIQVIRNNKPNFGRPALEAKKKKVFVLSEEELNSYLVQWIQSQAGRKNSEIVVKSAMVRLEAGRRIKIEAVIQVGVASLKMLEGDSFFGRTLKKYLAMDNTVVLEALVSSAKGKAFIKVTDARLKGIVLPDSFLQTVLQLVGQKQRPRRDFNKLFDLPNGIEKVEILPQLAKIHLNLF